MKSFLLPLLSLLLVAPAMAGPSLTADEIVRRYNENSFYQGNDFQAQVAMVITDKEGRTRERIFSMFRKDAGESGQQFFFVYFKKPTDIRNSTFLVHKFIDQADHRWMYLPSLDLVKRIAASDKRTSFMGSHYFYEDISGRNIGEDRHELLEETAGAYVVRSSPVDAEMVEFSSYTRWIDKNTFLPLKAEFKDKNGKLYRVAEVLAQEIIQGYPTLTRTRVSDVVDGGNTVTVLSNIKYDANLSDDLFSERYLRKPPRELLH